MKFKKKILKNGMRVIAVPLPESLTTTVLVLVETGSKYETKDINGISHFLEHMCFKGTSKRPHAMDIAGELDSIGAQYNAFTGQEYTGYWAKANFKKTSKILDIVSDIYLNPVFNEKEIEKEKGVIVEEINMYEDMPARDIQDVFDELLYGDQPAGWKILGNKETVKGFAREDFIKYRNKHYVAEATTVIVAGRFDDKKIVSAIEKKFKNASISKKYTKKKVKEEQKRPHCLVKYKKTDQSHLVIGFRSYDIFHKQNVVLNVIAGVLGGGMSSRLFQKLREEMGVAYYVRAYNDASTDCGVFQASAGVDNKRIKEVVKTILLEFKKIKTELVSEEELTKVKDYLIGNMYLDLESSDELASFYGMQEVLKKDENTPQEFARRIKDVTSGQIKMVANKIFTNDRLNMALIGPYKDKKTFSGILKL